MLKPETESITSPELHWWAPIQNQWGLCNLHLHVQKKSRSIHVDFEKMFGMFLKRCFFLSGKNTFLLEHPGFNSGCSTVSREAELFFE
jgi:hypothetical protein